MTITIHDIHISDVVDLPAPHLLRQEQPVGEIEAAFIARARSQTRDVLHGKNDRLRVIAGPFSIHDSKLVIKYAGRMRDLAARHVSDLLLVMRVYFEKPRTRMGWKGLIYDPGLDGRATLVRVCAMLAEFCSSVRDWVFRLRPRSWIW